MRASDVRHGWSLMMRLYLIKLFMEPLLNWSLKDESGLFPDNSALNILYFSGPSISEKRVLFKHFDMLKIIRQYLSSDVTITLDTALLDLQLIQVDIFYVLFRLSNQLETANVELIGLSLGKQFS